MEFHVYGQKQLTTVNMSLSVQQEADSVTDRRINLVGEFQLRRNKVALTTLQCR